MELRIWRGCEVGPGSRLLISCRLELSTPNFSPDLMATCGIAFNAAFWIFSSNLLTREIFGTIKMSAYVPVRVWFLVVRPTYQHEKRAHKKLISRFTGHVLTKSNSIRVPIWLNQSIPGNTIRHNVDHPQYSLIERTVDVPDKLGGTRSWQGKRKRKINRRKTVKTT